MSPFRRVFRFLASLKLAVILLLSLGVILGTATWIESKYDAKTASHLVYGHWLFYLFLFMLGVNVLCAALIRYPWKKHQTGFVIVHLGIIVILVGSFITRIYGLEGNMSLAEGQASQWVTVDQSLIVWQPVTNGPQGPVAGALREVPVEFRWNPPTEAQPMRVPLAEGLVARVDQYIHNAEEVEEYRPAEGAAAPSAPPAVRVELSAGKGAPMPEGTVMADAWLSLDDAEHGELSMGPATLRLVRAETPKALEQMRAGDTANALDTSHGVLRVERDGRPVEIAVAGHEGQAVAVDGTPYRIRIDRYLPFAVVKKNQLVNREGAAENPAVEITVLDEKGEAERQIHFARFPDFATAHHRKRPSRLKITYAMEETRRASNGLTFVVGPDGRLYARLDAASGRSHSIEVKVGEKTSTGWRMNLAFTVKAYFPHAQAVREFVPRKPSRGKDGLPPAIRVTVEGAEQPGPHWLGLGDSIPVTRSGGDERGHVAFQLAAVDVGFKVRLDNFEVGYDPGTRSPATYTSKVTVNDAARKREFDATITMNEPMYYNDLTFFQASFGQAQGGGEVSTFQVARDPGVPVKYTGSILLVLGIALYVFSGPPRNRSGGRASLATKTPGADGAQAESDDGAKAALEEPR